MISKSLESSVKYPKKILGIHNVPKRPKRIQKDPKSMFLHVSINLFHEAEPSNWTLSVMVSGSLRSRIVPISINPPDVGPSTSCKIVRPWFCSKNYVEETDWNMVSILLADAQLNWTSILLKFGYHRSSVLLREERLRVLWCRTRLNRQRRAGMRWLTCL